MKVLVVSGIWPPDIGGPATHAPELAEALTERGHEVEVVTTALRPPLQRRYPVHFVSRARPAGVRHLEVAALVARRSADADVVYATSMLGRSSLAARAPLVVKVAGDAAFERSRRRGLYAGTLADFQAARLGVRGAALRRWRTLAARRAAHVFCPSEFLRDVVVSWGIPPEKVSVLPNPAPDVSNLPARAALRADFDVSGPTLAFAGRFTRAKALDVLSRAIARVEDVTLLAAGEGEDGALLTGERVRVLGSLPRERVLELLAAADAAVLSSSWENFPHVLVEALAAGTPAIATRVGGVPEIVEDGRNGLLVPPDDPEALATAIGRFFAEPGLRERLAAAARPSVERFSFEAVTDTLEAVLLRASRPEARRR